MITIVLSWGMLLTWKVGAPLLILSAVSFLIGGWSDNYRMPIWDLMYWIFWPSWIAFIIWVIARTIFPHSWL